MPHCTIASPLRGPRRLACRPSLLTTRRTCPAFASLATSRVSRRASGTIVAPTFSRRTRFIPSRTCRRARLTLIAALLLTRRAAVFASLTRRGRRLAPPVLSGSLRRNSLVTSGTTQLERTLDLARHRFRRIPADGVHSAPWRHTTFSTNSHDYAPIAKTKPGLTPGSAVLPSAQDAYIMPSALGRKVEMLGM